MKNARHRNQGQESDLKEEEAGDNPQDVLPPQQSTSTDVDEPVKGGSMQLLTGQLAEQHFPTTQDLKQNPKAIPSTYFPPAYEQTKNRRNLSGDYTQMTHKFDSNRNK